VKLRQYFPISVGIFALMIAADYYFGFRAAIAPMAVILLVGETIMGFQVEDHKVGRVLGNLFKKGGGILLLFAILAAAAGTSTTGSGLGAFLH